MSRTRNGSFAWFRQASKFHHQAFFGSKILRICTLSVCVKGLLSSTAVGIHSRKTWQIYNFKTTLGGETCFSDVNMHIGKFTALHSALFLNWIERCLRSLQRWGLDSQCSLDFFQVLFQPLHLNARIIYCRICRIGLTVVVWVPILIRFMQMYVEQSILRAFIMIITLGRRDRVKLNNTPALRASSTRGDKCGEESWV